MGWIDILMWVVPPGIGVTIFWRRIDRGRKRVEEATPQLVALGNRAPQPSLALELNNEGTGEALNVTVSLDGCNRRTPPLARIAPGSAETTGQVFYNDSPIYLQTLDNPRLYIRYQSRYGLPYETIYNVTQQERDDGNYNPNIDFDSHSFVEPHIGWLGYFKLGK